MIEQKLKRISNVDPFSERRCKGHHGSVGQCPYEAIEGTELCARHTKGYLIDQQEKKKLNLYRIGRYEERVKELKEATGARTLDEELAILRMCLEEILVKCDSEGANGILLWATKIGALVEQIKGTILATERLSIRSGLLLDRTQALAIGQLMIDVISEFVTDEDTLAKIASRLSMIFTEAMVKSDASKHLT